MTDLKLALRMACKTPGLTFVAFACLAVGIGLTAAAFHLVYGAFLRPLPVPGGDRLVMVREYHRAGRYNVSTTPEQFRRWVGQARSFEALGAWQVRNIALQVGNARAQIVRAAYVTPNALAMVAATPRLGRTIKNDDAKTGATPVIVLSSSVWRQQFAADPAVLGRSVRVGGHPHVVIGVMRERFAFPIREYAWIALPGDPAASLPTGDSVQAFAKIKQGVSFTAAQAELAALRDPDTTDQLARAQTEVLLRPFTRGFMAPEEEWAVYGVLLGLLLFLLVMAGNVAGLLLARNAARMREIALRTALGASRAQLMRQFLTESALLGGMSAAAGLVLASACLSYVTSRVNDLPWWFSADLSIGMAGFAAVAALLATAVAGIAPALKLTRVSASDVLKSGNLCTGRLRFSWLSRALIAAQIAVTIGFVTTLAMLGHALFGFGYEKYGLPAREVLVAQLYFGQPPNLTPQMSTAARRAEWSRFLNACREKQREIARRLYALPDVREVSYASLLPGNDVESAAIEFEPEAGVPRRDQQPQTRVVEIGPGFFPLMGVRPTQGRDFLPPEHEGDPRAVIVNEPFARKYFSGAGALGRRLRLAPTAGQPAGQWLEIVGVVRDLGLNPGDPDRADGIYMPLGPTNVVRLAIRSGSEPSLLAPAVHEIAGLADPRVQVQWTVTLEKQMADVVTIFRSMGSGLLLIGSVALLLSAVSVHSLVSFTVTQRTREIGICLALGAGRMGIVGRVFRREGVHLVAGAVAGVALAAGLSRLVMLAPFDLRLGEPQWLALCLAWLLAAGTAACIVPLLRALRMQPTEALRHE